MRRQIGFVLVLVPLLNLPGLALARADAGFDIGSLSSILGSDPESIIRRIPHVNGAGLGNINSIKSLGDIGLTGKTRYGMSGGRMQEFLGVTTKGGGSGYLPISGLQQVMKKFGASGSRNQIMSMLKGAGGGRMPALSGASMGQLSSMMPKNVMPMMMKFAEKNPEMVRKLASSPQIASLMKNKDIMKMMSGMGGISGMGAMATPSKASSTSTASPARARASSREAVVAKATPIDNAKATPSESATAVATSTSAGKSIEEIEPIPQGKAAPTAAAQTSAVATAAGNPAGGAPNTKAPAAPNVAPNAATVGKQECAKNADEFKNSEGLKKAYATIGNPFKTWTGSAPFGMQANLSPKGNGQWHVGVSSFHNEDFAMSVCADANGKPYFDTSGKRVAVNTTANGASAYLGRGGQGLTFSTGSAQ